MRGVLRPGGAFTARRAEDGQRRGVTSARTPRWQCARRILRRHGGAGGRTPPGRFFAPTMGAPRTTERCSPRTYLSDLKNGGFFFFYTTTVNPPSFCFALCDAESIIVSPPCYPRIPAEANCMLGTPPELSLISKDHQKLPIITKSRYPRQKTATRVIFRWPTTTISSSSPSPAPYLLVAYCKVP